MPSNLLLERVYQCMTEATGQTNITMDYIKLCNQFGVQPRINISTWEDQTASTIKDPVKAKGFGTALQQWLSHNNIDLDTVVRSFIKLADSKYLSTAI